MKNRKGSAINTPSKVTEIEKRSSFPIINNSKKHAAKQRFCQCGAEISRDSLIFENSKTCDDCRRKQMEVETIVSAITTTPRKIEKSIYCTECKKLVPVRRMSSALVVCKPCLAIVQSKGASAQNHFLAKITQSFQLLARRSLSGGLR